MQDFAVWRPVWKKPTCKTSGVDARIILTRILNKMDEESMDWIDLAQDKGRWRALVNAVMNLLVPQMCGIR